MHCGQLNVRTVIRPKSALVDSQRGAVGTFPADECFKDILHANLGNAHLLLKRLTIGCSLTVSVLFVRFVVLRTARETGGLLGLCSVVSETTASSLD